MSVLDDSERKAYLNSPYFKKAIYEDFTPFYITIAICAVVGTILFIINIAFGCCSRYSQYWNDRHTGNRFIASLWTATPHKQPALDYTEINPDLIPQKIVYETPAEYTDIEFSHGHHQPVVYSPKHQVRQAAEYLELHQQKIQENKMFHVYWPATAALTLVLIVGVIMLMLKYGARCLKLRHEPLPDETNWKGRAYEQRVAYEYDV